MQDSIYVTKSAMPSFEEYIEEIKDCWETHWLTNMGAKHELFREKVRDYLKVKEIDLFTNGHMALELSLQAMKLTGEVITTPFTFASTTHAIVRNHLTPVFCDIDPEDFTLDVRKIEDLITDRTSAILPVHVYGNICQVEEIERIAKAHGLKVIYDAAHAFGCTYKNRGIGSFGDASCFSFHATKVFHTIEGGAVCHNDEKLGSRLYELKNFGIYGPELVNGIGTNAKMNEFCAAMGLCNLRHIEEHIAKRKRLTEIYRNNLEKVAGLQLNPKQDHVRSNYAYFPIIVDENVFGMDRDQLAGRLAQEGIYVRKYFYPLTSMFDCYKDIFDSDATPVAKRISQRVLTLPIYPDLAESDVKRICEILMQCKEG